MAYYFFNKCRFYCSCFYFSMLIFRVFFNYIICYFFVKLILDTPNKKGTLGWVFQPFPEGFHSSLWLSTRLPIIRGSHTQPKAEQFQLWVLYWAPYSDITIRWNCFSEFEIYGGKYGNIGAKIYRSLPQKSEKDRETFSSTRLKANRGNRWVYLLQLFLTY